MPWGAGATLKAAEAARHHSRSPCGPSTNSCGENCAVRGDLVEMLAPPGPEGGTFEGLDGAGFEWELVGLLSG